MSIFFNYNGKFYKEGTPVIGPDSRALRYGDGLFETMKMKAGSLIFVDEHLARLWTGMRLLQIDPSKHFTPDLLEAEIIALAKKNNHDQVARIRLNVFRGDGGLYDAKNHRPNYIIQSWQLPEEAGRFNSNGLVIGIYEGAKKCCDPFSNIKHNNYLPYVLAALKAKQEKWNDALLLNTNGRICDSTIANVFIIKNEEIFTPALNEGCVAGVIRKQLIQHLRENNYVVNETEIERQFVLDADEVFLTNSSYNLRWVKQSGDSIYSNTLTQKIFTQASAALNW